MMVNQRLPRARRSTYYQIIVASAGVESVERWHLVDVVQRRWLEAVGRDNSNDNRPRRDRT
jgi:hypothetical protein